ncbi:hypothetical protein Tco_0671845 [Tanacetum coccineum]
MEGVWRPWLEMRQQGGDVATWWPREGVWFDLYMAVFGQPTSVSVKWLPFTNRNSDKAQTSENGIFGSAFDDEDLDTYNSPFANQVIGILYNMGNLIEFMPSTSRWKVMEGVWRPWLEMRQQGGDVATWWPRENHALVSDPLVCELCWWLPPESEVLKQ